MKRVQQIEENLPEKFKRIIEHDKLEIDNPIPYHHGRLNYIDRLDKIISVLRRKFPDPENVRMADIGCAQGNLSLLMAEKGYDVTAIDINPVFLEYAKLKQEKGKIKWVLGNFDSLRMEGLFDIIMLGEIVEHCAYPEDFMEKAAGYLKPGGILLVTTPNARMFMNNLPTFGSLRRREDRKFLEERQFGPDGEDHLFLFTLPDLKLIQPKELKLEESGYIGGTVLINKRTIFMLSILPKGWPEALERIIARIPLLNKFTSHEIYAVYSRI
jgi:2-polyprenyl-3-methyl-5-hydroxy-6-metoxy-1,4-benzoquinol methylase